MNEVTGTANTKPEGRAAALLAHYERAGYVRSEPALLQPAEPFLDLSGEDIRRRMYLTTDAAGHELCLRPALTIPASRDHLAPPAAGKPAGFCYLGPVFRYRPNAPGEFAQGGIESFGRRDSAAADAEMISLETGMVRSGRRHSSWPAASVVRYMRRRMSSPERSRNGSAGCQSAGAAPARAA